MPIETQKDMKTYVNEASAKALGVTIPESVLKGAEITK